jgi:hypothetical protein
MVIPSLKTDEDGWFNLKNQMLALLFNVIWNVALVAWVV